jgi:hypothetical protein
MAEGRSPSPNSLPSHLDADMMITEVVTRAGDTMCDRCGLRSRVTELRQYPIPEASPTSPAPLEDATSPETEDWMVRKWGCKRVAAALPPIHAYHNVPPPPPRAPPAPPPPPPPPARPPPPRSPHDPPPDPPAWLHSGCWNLERCMLPCRRPPTSQPHPPSMHLSNLTWGQQGKGSYGVIKGLSWGVVTRYRGRLNWVRWLHPLLPHPPF